MNAVAIMVIIVAAIFAGGVLLGATSVISLSVIRRSTERIWDIPHQFRDPRDWWPAPPGPRPITEIFRDPEEHLQDTPNWTGHGHQS